MREENSSEQVNALILRDNSLIKSYLDANSYKLKKSTSLVHSNEAANAHGVNAGNAISWRSGVNGAYQKQIA
jgi:hypothetical protein